MMDKDDFINASESTPVKLLSDLVKLRLFPDAIDAKRKGIELIGKVLERFGIEPEFIETRDGCGHLFASVNIEAAEKGASGEYGKGLLLMSSTEVPDYPNLPEWFGEAFGDPVKDWRYNPFSGLIINGRIYGAGSFYFLMPVVAQVMAICGVKTALSGGREISRLTGVTFGGKKRKRKKKRGGSARKNKRKNNEKKETESMEDRNKTGQSEIMLPILYEPAGNIPKESDSSEDRPGSGGQHSRPVFNFKKVGILILSTGLPDYLRKKDGRDGFKPNIPSSSTDILYGIIKDIKENHPGIFDYDTVITGELGFSVRSPSGIMGRLFGSRYKKYITVGIASKVRGLYTVEIRGGRIAPPGIPFEKEDTVYILDDILKELIEIKFGPIYGHSDKFVSILAGRSVSGTVRIPSFALINPGRIMSYIRPQLIHTLAPIEITTLKLENFGDLTPVGIRITLEARIVPKFTERSEVTDTEFMPGAPTDGNPGKNNIEQNGMNGKDKNRRMLSDEKNFDDRNDHIVKGKEHKNRRNIWDEIGNVIHGAVNKAVGKRTTIGCRVKCIFKDELYNIPPPYNITSRRSFGLLSTAAEKGGGYIPVTVLVPYYNIFSAVKAVLFPEVTDIYAICPRPIPVRFGRFPDPYGFPPFVNDEHVPISTLISAAEFYRNITGT